jgi:hypothetical protein
VWLLGDDVLGDDRSPVVLVAQDDDVDLELLGALDDDVRGVVFGRLDQLTVHRERCTPAGADPDSVVDVRAVFQQGHRELAVDKMPPVLLPRKGRLGLIDYEKMFSAHPTGAGNTSRCVA